MMNGPDPISSEGVPFTFQRYQHQGDIGDWDEAVENKGELRKKEIPLQNSILRFDLDPY
jgi:hypothetical protein